MTPRLMRGIAFGLWVLAAVGFVLAFTVDGDAINMALGCGIAAVPTTVALVWPL